MAFLPIPRSDRKVDLTGKVALITGAGNGIGKETALRLAEAGARLILVDIDRSAVDDVAATFGTRASGYVADVTDYAALDAAIRAGIERFGGIDIVVANAGVGTYGSFRNMGPDTFRRGIDINVNGVFFHRAGRPPLDHRTSGVPTARIVDGRIPTRPRHGTLCTR